MVMNLQYFGGRGGGSGTTGYTAGGVSQKSIDEAIKNGARVWNNYGKSRLYIDASNVGLEIERYKTGNISSAKINGEEISNSKAKDMMQSNGYIDLNTGEISIAKGPYRNAVMDMIKNKIKIKKK